MTRKMDNESKAICLATVTMIASSIIAGLLLGILLEALGKVMIP